MKDLKQEEESLDGEEGNHFSKRILCAKSYSGKTEFKHYQGLKDKNVNRELGRIKRSGMEGLRRYIENFSYFSPEKWEVTAVFQGRMYHDWIKDSEALFYLLAGG